MNLGKEWPSSYGAKSSAFIKWMSLGKEDGIFECRLGFTTRAPEQKKTWLGVATRKRKSTGWREIQNGHKPNPWRFLMPRMVRPLSSEELGGDPR
jgi:hypothetical protein